MIFDSLLRFPLSRNKGIAGDPPLPDPEDCRQLFDRLCGSDAYRRDFRIGERAFVMIGTGLSPLEEEMMTAWLMERDCVRGILLPAELSEERIRTLKKLYTADLIASLSELYSQPWRADKIRVVIIDLPVELPLLYRWGDCAYIGCHEAELLKAALCGLPLLGNMREFHDPHGHSSEHAANLLAHGGALNIATPAGFARNATLMLYDAVKRHQTGIWAREYALDEQKRTLNC